MTIFHIHLRHIILVICHFCALTILVTANAAQLPEADGLIVKFRASTSQSSLVHALSTSGLRTVESFALVPGLTHVRAVAGETLQTTLSAIQTNPNVEYAEPNYYVNALVIPNDPDFPLQYGLNNTGQTGGTAGADIKAVETWDIQRGNDIIIAIIDTGVDYNHEEIVANIWTNSNEIPNNGLDDDNNGFIDDYYGWDFSNNDNDPLDDMGHGTHVAGIIAANTNNGIGISGVNWRAKIMSLKFIDAAGIGTTTNAIKAINYAVLMGAKISNNSWGGGAFTQGLYDTIAAANQVGHLFVAAAGNSGIDTDDPLNSKHYPSSYELINVISVAATDEFDILGTFSNYGAVSVDLAAPGRQIYSLWLNNGYLTLDGTSMAAPFVTGAAGLIMSTLPSLTIPEVRAALLDNVDPIPGLSGLMVTGGRLNLLRSVNSVSANILVTPSTKHIAVDDNLSFFASGGTLPYSWSVTSPGVAQIDSASGLLIGVRRGVTQVIVQDSNGFNARTDDIFVDVLSITPSVAIFDIGQSIQFVAVGGVPPYSWTSSNPNAIQIDNLSGVAVAKAAGQGLIIVRDSNGITFQSELLEVVFIPDLVLNTPQNSLSVGDVFRFNAQGGVPPYTYGSLDTTIATIDAGNGAMKALRSGTAQIFVEDAAGTRVVHSNIQIQSIQVFPAFNSMRINETQTLNVVGGTPPFEWRVTNSLVASIDVNGLLTALSSGSIKVTVMDVEGNIAATEIISISTSQALNLGLLPSIVAVNEKIQLSIAGGTAPYALSVSNSAVLSVNQSAQTITARGGGVAIVNVEDTTGEVVSSNPIEVRNIGIFPQTLNFIVRDTMQFSATGGVPPYLWTTSDMALVSMSSSGAFLAKMPGKAMITATDSDGIVKSVEIKINSTTVMPMFDVIPRSATLSKRSSNGLTFIASGGAEPYTYSLSAPIGSIDQITGEYSPMSDVAGITTIIVTDANGNVSESGNISIR